jgi:hypothetical protein
MPETKLTSESLSVLGKQIFDVQLRDIERDLSDLNYDGFTSIPDYVIAFLKKYSGVEFEAISEYYGCRYEVCIGLFKAHEIPGLKSIVAEAEVILKKSLYPVGSMDIVELEEYGSSDRVTLIVAEDGSIYSSVSNVIHKEGCDINDFINRTVTDQQLGKENDKYTISYSQYDPRIKELRKKELIEQRLAKTR